MLYIGEEVGDGDPDAPEIDIAVDPLEGTNLCANGVNDALAVVAMAEDGQFLNAPDTYMDKIAVGPGARGAIDIRKSATHNLARDRRGQARARRRPDRRHPRSPAPRGAGRRGAQGGRAHPADLRRRRRRRAWRPPTRRPASTCCWATGGAPEGVLAAAALRCIGGDMQGVLKFRNDEERARATRMGITDLDHVYADRRAGERRRDVRGHRRDRRLPAARRPLHARRAPQTSSIVMRSRSGTVRYHGDPPPLRGATPSTTAAATCADASRSRSPRRLRVC